MLRTSLKQAIEAHGPIPISTYMRQCLTHPTDGYYVKQDPFGSKGDFITSPEISQMFGELVGINILMQWMEQGSPKKIRLAELGPGRGTLMDDLLRTVKSFPDFFNAIQTVDLVEASPTLRNLQKQRLGRYGLNLNWFEMTRQVPKDKVPTYLVAHEFFDALPIQQFQLTEKGWQERMVMFNKAEDEFQTTLQPVNPLMSQTLAAQPRFTKLPLTSEIELSTESWQVAREIGHTLSSNTGSALIIDYGPLSTIPVNTFRGFSKHKQVSPYDMPGDSDLTADVDFQALKDIFSSFKSLNSFGPVMQGDWLHQMGIGARATVLANSQQSAEGKQRIADAYNRLTDMQFMGKTYKVMNVSTGHESTGFQQ
ncbi:NADH dehydrogenase [ubiquinone] complex I, assembly factor 7 [Wickerhamiella sorbophila]|uniref:Protein arginine methyltransferase NDUFAF7 n=1 Tax=Wickerhamiella sorbophila TaxID=45607 RepID=A0A2T0FEQ7_9ASCO|nr:NADH dehydrogenase [ubiquinone] complex I, assembly factor 7 [Wickerhamiella sorbophila]PRT53483.1 NADH dehydrogenase [ubiquinone] complex I, assembly factor 7 [Wickerhamiella sorbophila]